MNNLILRTLTGIVFVALLVGGTLWSPVSFVLLFAVVTGLATWEFSENVNAHAGASVNKLINTVAAVSLFVAFAGFSADFVPSKSFVPYLLSIIYLLVSELYLKKPDPLKNWAYAFASQVYIALPFALLNGMINTENGYSGLLPLSIFIFLWLNDTGAYLAGSLLHKKIPYKLAPRISPHQTWIGSIGGVIVVLAAGTVLYRFTQTGTIWVWMGLGLTVSIFGTYGDLVESLLKRSLGMKDSGKFLPGHGGVLDRFDSALIAIPAATIYTYGIHFTF